jgi:hypothetical protein
MLAFSAEALPGSFDTKEEFREVTVSSIQTTK